MPSDIKPKRKTYFIVAGEASGDLHGAKLIAAMKKRSPDIRFVGLGGDKMLKEGLEILYRTDQLGVMGFSEIIKHIPFFIKALNVTMENIVSIQAIHAIIVLLEHIVNMKDLKHVRNVMETNKSLIHNSNMSKYVTLYRLKLLLA